MCLLRAYGGYPTLVCHLGLKDMQRSRPRFPKTLYVTAPVAGRSLGPQVVAISKKNEIVITMSTENSRTYSTNEEAVSRYGGRESASNSGAEYGASDGQEWTRTKFAMAIYL